MVTSADPVDDPFAAAEASAAVLALATGASTHDVVVVLGSGWKPAVDRMGEVAAEVSMAELGGFAEASVTGHGTTVRSIVSGDQRVLAFMGRLHLYEGHHPNVVSHAVRTAVRAGCRTVAPDLAEGTYAGFLGPTYETPAEVAMARTLGADLVGMSTVTETIAAVHAGAEVLGVSLVTNLAAGTGADALDHDDVLAVAAASADRMGGLIADVVSRL